MALYMKYETFNEASNKYIIYTKIFVKKNHIKNVKFVFQYFIYFLGY